MRYIDTNVLVYAIEGHPKYGKACRRILDDAASKREEFCSSSLVLAELLGVLFKLNKIRQTRSRFDTHSIVNAAMALPIVWIDLDPIVVKKASSYSLPVSTNDLIHLATMELNSVHEIVTADTDFDEAPFIKRLDPLDY